MSPPEAIILKGGYDMTTPDLMSWKCKLGLILILTAPYEEESTMTVNI